MKHDAPVDLEGALLELGLQIHRSTDDEVTCYCPGHLERTGREERNPSWSVNRTSGLHNCYSCGFSGTFLDLVMSLLFPSDIFRAARWMRRHGINLARSDDLVQFDQQVPASVEQIEMVPETRLAMFADVPDWALEARMLNRESVDHYGVRWNTKNDAWIIPVRTPQGDLAGWQEKWQGKRRFMNRPKDMLKSLCLFGFGVFPVGEPAVLLESPLDVCRLYAAGFEGGMASYGTEVSRRQVELILTVTDELVVAFDNDVSGMKHAAQLRSGKWERGKMVTPPITRHLHMRYLSYQHTKAKDLGDMDDTAIELGLYEAQHWTVAVLGTEEQEKHQRGVRGNSKAVPTPRRRADGRPRAVPGVRGSGNGKDAVHRRSNRRAS